MPTSQTLYNLIPYFRGTISTLSLASFITLFSYPKSPGDNFNVLQQLALNVSILFAYAYSLYSNNSPSHRPLYPVYRMGLICTAFVLSWVYGMGPLVRILGNQGCGHPVYAEAVGRCNMQVGVSSVEIVWTILMFGEGLLTDKRNRDKSYREMMGWELEVDGDSALANRARAQQELASRESRAARFGVVEYQPDLSLEGAGGGGGAAGRRRVVGVNEDHEGDSNGQELEMEPLPPYMPKARSNQAVIVDMTYTTPERPASAALQDPEHHESQLQRPEQPQQGDQTAPGESPSSSSSLPLPTIQPPPPAQLPLQPGQQQQQQTVQLPGQQQQQQQQQHSEPIHPQGGPGTGLPRVPSYSE